MAKLAMLSLSLCFVLLFSGSCLARQQQPQGFNECQLDRLEALEPDHRIKAEAGEIESWDPNNDQLQCAGVALVKRTIEPNGLHLPSYTNAPQLHYIIKGEGILGAAFPGCPETFEEPQQEKGEESEQEDRHQKIRRFREGDIIALPAGVAYWTYNNGDRPLVTVTLLDTSNLDNQLDQNPRRFYLAGNPDDEHPQSDNKAKKLKSLRGSHKRNDESEGSNIFSGFDDDFLAEIWGVNVELVRRIQGREDDRSNIVNVKGGLSVVSPPLSREEREREEREERESESRRDNGLEETICSLRLRENVGDAARADIYNPEAGRLTSLNSLNLPILRYLQLSAQYVKLYANGIFVPHWNVNAHSIGYVTKGRGRVQVADCDGNTVFDDEVRKGQVLVVPQNYVVAAQAGDEGFEFVAFKTNDKAVITPLAGRTSALRAFPLDVLRNAFNIRTEDAWNLKFNQNQNVLVSSQGSQSDKIRNLKRLH